MADYAESAYPRRGVDNLHGELGFLQLEARNLLKAFRFRVHGSGVGLVVL